MYPGSNNYNNQYPNYPNQPPVQGGPSIGFNVGQPGYNVGQPGYNAGQPGYNAGQPGYNVGQSAYIPSQPGYNAPQGYGQQYVGGVPNPHMAQGYDQGQHYPQAGIGQIPPTQAGFNQSACNQYNAQHTNPPAVGGSIQTTGHNPNLPQVGNQQNVNQGMASSGIVYDVEVVRGTIKPFPNFNAEQDCNVLRKAMKGIGTDENSIIECLGRRSLDQRLAIKKTYKTMFGKDLIDSLKSELSGDFSRAVVESLYDSEYYDAHSLNKAMEGAGTREEILTEILTSRTNEEIETIKVLYKKWFNKDLEKHVISETSGFYKRVLVSCLQANKKELTAEEFQKLRQFGPSAVVNANQAAQEAAELYNAGEKKLGTDEAVFIKIFALRNRYQLRATFAAYEKLSGHNIIRAIETEMSGDLSSALKAIALQVTNEPLYFATRLYKSMKGAGTTDSTLIRVILTRSEIDMENIKKEFQKQYNKSLTDFVRQDTSGDYGKYLLRFVEGN